MGAAPWLDGVENVTIIGLDSDGTDGPTQFAGAVIDEKTMERIRDTGLDLFSALKRHDVSPLLNQLGDAILTGNTGTNVNDLKLMVIWP
jgi:hydroxypyruvate reductase/glycerate 2-kinase